jgi:hypothetical protein
MRRSVSTTTANALLPEYLFMQSNTVTRETQEQHTKLPGKWQDTKEPMLSRLQQLYVYSTSGESYLCIFLLDIVLPSPLFACLRTRCCKHAGYENHAISVMLTVC